MNKEIKHLFGELDRKEEELLLKNFEQSPKMLLYIAAIKEFGFVSTNKAINCIYKEEQVEFSEEVLRNRFYKLRHRLHLYLLRSLKNVLKNSTDEEMELKFLQLLLLKNEHAYVLEKAKKIEAYYWETNLFELLPDLMNIIVAALHLHQSRSTEEIASYNKKLDQANELLYTLNKFKSLVNSFRAQYISGFNYEELAAFYTTNINKIRRKVNSLKGYPRFNLIYHYISFSMGSLFQNVVLKSANVLVRHLNQLEKLLDQNPNTPIVNYGLNHRLYDRNQIQIKKAIFWYQKGNSIKSYQAILDNEQLIADNQSVYISSSGNDFFNKILCCWGAQEYEAMFKYIAGLKEFQIINSSINKETPYFVYELLAYIGLFPTKKHSHPLKIITQSEIFLKGADEKAAWIYGVVGTFAMLYGYLEKSRFFLGYDPLMEEYNMPHCIPTIALLDVVESNDQKAMIEFLQKIKTAKKHQKDRGVITHLDELEKLTKVLLK